MIQKIYQLRRDGLSKTGLCNALGFTSRTLNQWLREAEREDADPILKELLSAYNQACADWESDMIHKLNENANSRQDWKAQAWQLKTKMPTEYSEKSPQLIFNQLVTNFMRFISENPELEEAQKQTIYNQLNQFDAFLGMSKYQAQQTQEN